MRWASKVMSNNQDQSQSKLSNRSLSKFKKVNLQKSEAQIASNEHLEKSVLKLTSVQKIKTLNLNRSFISNYAASIQHQSQQNSRAKFLQNPASETEKSKQNNFHAQSSKSIKTQYPKILDFISQVKPASKQGFGVFQKQQKFANEQVRIESDIQTQNPQNLNPSQKLTRIMNKFQQALFQFKQVLQNLKKDMNQTISSGVLKLSQQLSTFAKQFESNFEKGVQQLIDFISKQKQSSKIEYKNLVKTDQIQPPSPENDSFYKIKNFQHEEHQQYEAQKPHNISRPNTFKNKFKQIIDDSSHENFVTKSQVEKDKVHEKQQERQKSSRKIVRKQTNPISVTRVNSLFRNESSVLNEDSFSNVNDKSTNSIKYTKIGNNRSASKSVKKLHEKLVLIKNIFKSGPSSSDTLQNEETKILV